MGETLPTGLHVRSVWRRPPRVTPVPPTLCLACPEADDVLGQEAGHVASGVCCHLDGRGGDGTSGDTAVVHSAGVCPWLRPEHVRRPVEPQGREGVRWPRPRATPRGLQDAPASPATPLGFGSARDAARQITRPVSAATCPRPAALRPSRTRRDSGGRGRPVFRPGARGRFYTQVSAGR